MIVIPLGTSAGRPTPARHLPAVAVQTGKSVLLFDCGEGTQLRLVAASVRLGKVQAICITHLHGDHYFGLMGLLSTMSLARRTSPLVIAAPEALKQIMEEIPGARSQDLTFEVEYVTLPDSTDPTVVYKTPGFTVEAHPVDHGVPAFGYRLQENPKPGRLNVQRAHALGIADYADFKKLKRGEPVMGEGGQRVTPDMVLGPASPPRIFAYSGDTRPCEGVLRLAHAADMLMHEATFAEDLRHKAKDTGHSTARQAAEAAQKAGVRTLLLTHFSSRYRDVTPLLEEAQATFPATEVPQELHRYPVPADHPAS